MCSDSEIQPGAVFRHHSGKLYRVEGIANTANFNPKYPPVVVYRSVVNQNWWTKPLEDFKAKMTLEPNLGPG